MKDQAEGSLVERHIVRIDAVEVLRQALDYGYRQLRQSARRNWEQHFAGQTDPSDACVTVRCSGFLPGRERSTRLSGRRFGH
jgi:hypothetical protein